MMIMLGRAPIEAWTTPHWQKKMKETEKCIGCGICARQCPANAITRTDYIAPGHKLASMVIDNEKCVKCGACVGACKFGAVHKA